MLFLFLRSFFQIITFRFFPKQLPTTLCFWMTDCSFNLFFIVLDLGDGPYNIPATCLEYHMRYLEVCRSGGVRHETVLRLPTPDHHFSCESKNLYISWKFKRNSQHLVFSDLWNWRLCFEGCGDFNVLVVSSKLVFEPSKRWQENCPSRKIFCKLLSLFMRLSTVEQSFGGYNSPKRLKRVCIFSRMLFLSYIFVFRMWTYGRTR